MGKYDDLFISKTPPNPKHPESSLKGGKALWTTFFINDEFNGKLKNAFYMESGLVTREHKEEIDGPGLRPHKHDWDEYVLFMGTNPEDASDLGGEVEFWIEDEKHMVTKTTAIFIPAGLFHVPFYFRKVDRPYLILSTGLTLRYRNLSYNMDPKWDGYKQYDDDKIGLPPIVKKARWEAI